MVFSTTRGPRRRDGDYERRFDRDALRAILARWGTSPERVYVCGSTPFVEAVANALVAEGVSPGRVKTERYGGA